MECNISTEFVLIVGMTMHRMFSLWNKWCRFLFVHTHTPSFVCLYTCLCTFHMRLKTTQSINCSQLFWICTYFMCSSGIFFLLSHISFCTMIQSPRVHNTIRLWYAAEREKKENRIKIYMKKIPLFVWLHLLKQMHFSLLKFWTS